MTEAEKNAFNIGYLIACCNIYNLHGDACVASDVLIEAGLTKSQAAAMDLSEYDAAALKEIRKARSEDPLRDT